MPQQLQRSITRMQDADDVRGLDAGILKKGSDGAPAIATPFDLGLNPTWANDAARAAVVPAATGVLGVQLDTGNIYISTGTSAGNWTILGVGMSQVTGLVSALAGKLSTLGGTLDGNLTITDSGNDVISLDRTLPRITLSVGGTTASIGLDGFFSPMGYHGDGGNFNTDGSGNLTLVGITASGTVGDGGTNWSISPSGVGSFQQLVSIGGNFFSINGGNGSIFFDAGGITSDGSGNLYVSTSIGCDGVISAANFEGQFGQTGDNGIFNTADGFLTALTIGLNNGIEKITDVPQADGQLAYQDGRLFVYSTRDTAQWIPCNLAIGATPTSPTPGMMYFNTIDHHFYGWNGTVWKQLDN